MTDKATENGANPFPSGPEAPTPDWLKDVKKKEQEKEKKESDESPAQRHDKDSNSEDSQQTESERPTSKADDGSGQNRDSEPAPDHSTQGTETRGEANESNQVDQPKGEPEFEPAQMQLDHSERPNVDLETGGLGGRVEGSRVAYSGKPPATTAALVAGGSAAIAVSTLSAIVGLGWTGGLVGASLVFVLTLILAPIAWMGRGRRIVRIGTGVAALGLIGFGFSAWIGSMSAGETVSLVGASAIVVGILASELDRL